MFIDDDLDAQLEYLAKTWPIDEWIRQTDDAQQLSSRIFTLDALQDREPLTVLLKGTGFQTQVWQALTATTFGELITYGTLAKRVRKAGAARAVGSAMAANTVGFLMPCHRVVRESGDISFYRWAPERKLAIQLWEAANASR